MRKIFDLDGKSISLGPVVGRGGEAVVYRLADSPGWIAKLYEPAPRPNYPAKLAWMLSHPPVDPTAALGHPSLAWPAALLYDQEYRLAGYRMPYIKEAAPILVVFNPRRRSEALPQFDRRYLHRTACNLATAIGALHQSSYIVGDLNESNILVKSSALVSLIDADSFQVQEPNGREMITYACPVAKPEYTPPELQGKPLSSIVRTSEQDAFGLGVLIFQLLMEGNHPFRAQWQGKGDPPPMEERIASGAFPYTATPGLPVCPPKYAPELDWLHPALTELIRRCFIDGHRDPRQRPGASAWVKAISKAENSLVQCSKGHVYSDHLSACPQCQAGRVTSRPATQPAGSHAQAGRQTTPAGSSQRNTAHASGSSAPHAAASSASQNPGGSAASKRVPPTGTPSGQASSAQGSANARRGNARQTGAGSSGNPRGQGTSGHPAGGPSVARGVRQAGHAWKTYRYWQSQSQQTGATSRNQAGQVKAAWSAWKYGQAGPAQAAGSNPPFSAGAAKSQTSPPPSASAQNNRTGTNSAGAGSTHQAQQSKTNTARAQQTWSAPFYTSPNQSQSTSSRPGMVSGTPGSSLLSWAGPRLYKSLAIGGGLGALVGAFCGSLIGVAGWYTAGSMMSWVLLWAIGGASAGLLRGWLPGYRVSLLVDQSIGWQRVLPVLGVLIGAGLGGVLGFAVCWWAIIPVFIGLYFGGKTGLKAGNKLWVFGAQYGWERIWACIGALCAGLVGARLALWLGAASLSTQLAGSFSTWISGQSASVILVALAVGALGGALGGIVAGTLTDLFARMFNLVD
jgi:serine/threonine protein kinase